jgi:hypothetical protein
VKAETATAMNDWLDALVAPATSPGAQGVTADEMVRATGKPPRWVGEQIRRAVADGRMVFVGKREGVGVDGRRKFTPVYARAAGASQRSMATSTGGRASTPTAKRAASRRASSGVRLPHVTR